MRLDPVHEGRRPEAVHKAEPGVALAERRLATVVAGGPGRGPAGQYDPIVVTAGHRTSPQGRREERQA
jgi:hypothetical protein